jgi:hypothetical protein
MRLTMLTHQWIPRFPPKLPTQKLNHSLKVIRNGHSKEVLLHYWRVSNRFEAHDNCREKNRKPIDNACHVSFATDGWMGGWMPWMDAMPCMHSNLLWDLSSCRTLEQRDPLQGPHRLQDLWRRMREISGWRLVSSAYRYHAAALQRCVQTRFRRPLRQLPPSYSNLSILSLKTLVSTVVITLQLHIHGRLHLFSLLSHF